MCRAVGQFCKLRGWPDLRSRQTQADQANRRQQETLAQSASPVGRRVNQPPDQAAKSYEQQTEPDDLQPTRQDLQCQQ